MPRQNCWTISLIILSALLVFTMYMLMPTTYPYVSRMTQKPSNSPTSLVPQLDRCKNTDLPCIANKLGTHTPAGPHRVLTMAILDDTYVEMFLNFASSARHCGVNNLLPVTLGEKANKQLSELGYLPYFETSMVSLSGQEHYFQSPEFKKKGAMKLIMTYRLVSLGYSVLLLDLDNVFVKNPFPFFKCHSCDIEIQMNRPGKINELCIGIGLFRATEKTKELLKRSVDIMRKDPMAWDQAVVSDQMKILQKENKLTYGVLPFDQFPTGYEIHNKQVNIHTYNISRSVIFHNNWSVWFRMKRYRFRELGAWYLDHNQYYSSTTRKYFTYDNCIPKFGSDERSSLNTAFRVAAILNRTLVLPVMHCWISGTQVCTLDQVLDIVKWDTAHENMYREHTFLKNTRVPASVRASVSNPIVILTDKLTSINPNISEPKKVFTPKNFTVGPTADELRHFVKTLEDFSVIKFHSLYFKIARDV